MLQIKADPEVLEKLAAILRSKPDGACVRLREYTIGAACHAKRILGPAIDKSPEDEERVTVGGITFVAEPDFLDTHGNSFALEMENCTLLVKPLADTEKPEQKKATVYADFSMDE